MKIIAGLGNQGKEYENTRHNSGFKVVELLCREWEFDGFKMEKRFDAELSTGDFKGEKIILAKPITFMNKSGEAISKLVNFYKIELKDLWICYDDVDLPLGEIRIRQEGSAGTHNGMRSIIQSLGNQDFPRFRVGIESRGILTAKEQDTASFVLNKFRPEEMKIINQALKRLTEEIVKMLKRQTELRL